MPLQTDLNVSPYFDDFSPNKDYYRVLFQPGVAVQARELNQLQSILQHQVEKFGDNIFKRGTIIDGCNITRHAVFPYVKIRDSETDGTPVNVAMFENLSVRNTNNVAAYIVKTVAGFESRSPDLNTLYVTYNNSGADQNTATFSASDTLTVFDTSYPIFKMKVVDGSSAFVNSDSIVVVSALAVQNSTGGATFPGSAFVAGQVIQNGVANATIIEANSTANSEALILKIKPLAVDLLAANNIKWRFGAGDTIRNATTANTASVVEVIGAGADGVLTTDSLGKITSVTVTSQGTGYYVPPHVTVQIESNTSITTAEINQLDITPLNYLATISVANAALSPIGTGYGLTVDDGTIYQKGFFSRVSSQLVVVNKYSNTDFTKSVGFFTNEDLINSNEDPTLLDNATGTYNYAAPGADRLRLQPVLQVLDKDVADANTDFLPIIEFADGRPYRQNLNTVYNIIGDELARRTYEESGNYVLDQFIVGTRDSTTFSDNATVFKLNIDPGKAYIKGYRVERTDNYVANVAKGVDTANNGSARVRLGYGNYLRVDELGGIFQFNTGAQVELYDTAKNYVSTATGAAITASGTKIGVARIRSQTLENGEPGHKDTVYRLYLFDIVMEQGKNFADVRSVYHPGTNKGIADVVLNAAGTCSLEDVRDTGLLFKAATAMKSANNITYTYRTINESETANSTGYIVMNLGSGEYFPYTEALGTSEKRELLVIPKEVYKAQANASGAANTTSGNTIVTGLSGINFQSNFNIGDYVEIANSTASMVRQVAQISGACTMILTTAADTTFTTANVRLYFPKNVPISLTNNPAKYANVDSSNTQVMTIYLGTSLANSSGIATSANVAVVHNAIRNNVSSAAKTTTRQAYVRVKTANNVGGVRGPWAMGVSDVFRLHSVHKANGASRAVSFNANTSVNTDTDFISITNNVYANGDSVVYSNTGMVSGVGGLANGSTYYVVYANSSGLALSATRGGANIDLTASATSENHTLTGSPLFFTSNTYGVVDVTNDFYIDSNQKEDYLDISYLYRKPRLDLLSGNDVLLVKYDVFSGGSGVKTISSYPIDDALSFDNLIASSNVNTLEMPEVIGTSGKYYDIRDQYDFRPKSSNTIPISTSVIANTVINPTEPTDANRFASVAEQYFPAPNSTLIANIEFYQGRVDRVVIDGSTNFVVRRGKPGSTDIPPEPKDSMTLQILNIPAYPSLPQALSANTVKIIDTKVANEAYGRRRRLSTITTSIDPLQRARIQVKSYKMADIAQLEKRIKDLEYYVSFTLAEALAKSRFIPSSLDALIDRFRYGFFVDPFTDYNYSDIGNPEFWCTIKDDQLGPHLSELNLEFESYDKSEGLLTLPYNEFLLVAQNDATDGPIPVAEPEPEPVDTSGPVTVTTVTQSTATVTQSQRNTSRSDTAPYSYDEFNYTMSSLVGPVEFYVNSRDNNIALEVQQSPNPSGPWTTTYTSASAQPITTSDISNKNLSGLNEGRPIEHPGEEVRKSYGPFGGFLEDQFKLLWTHNPNAGRYYKLNVYKGKNHGSKGKGGTYEFKLFYPTDAVTTNTITVSNPATYVYNGLINTLTPSEFTLTQSTSYVSTGFGSVATNSYIADSQKFTIAVTGLKSSTRHKFMFNGEDQTAKCSQIRNSTTNTTGLVSDVNGVINFEFYFDAGINEASTDLAQQNKLAAAAAGIKSFSIESFDGTSKANGTIGLKYYTSIPESYSTNEGLNVSPSATDSATGTTTTITQSPADQTQAVYDAIESQNVKTVDLGNGVTYNNNIGTYKLF